MRGLQGLIRKYCSLKKNLRNLSKKQSYKCKMCDNENQRRFAFIRRYISFLRQILIVGTYRMLLRKLSKGF